MNKRTTYHSYKENVWNDKSDENHPPVHENTFCHCFTRKVRNGWLSDEILFPKRVLMTVTNYLPTYLPNLLTHGLTDWLTDGLTN